MERVNSSNYNEERYKSLLERLEISIVSKSEVTKENDVFRLDSQYFKKAYLIEDENRKKYPNISLGEIAFITDGQHGYHEVDEESPIRHLTAKNAKNWFANDIAADRIAKWVDDKNKRSSLEKDDLILSTRGTVGFCALVDEDVLPANIDQDVARIKLKSNIILPTVVLAYINSKIGRNWLKKNETGMVQQGIALWRVREIPIPIFSKKFQEPLDSLIRLAKNKIDQSKDAFNNAENLLIRNLGLDCLEPNKNPIKIKNFKESFLTTGRFDAEYYQQKYEDYLKTIYNFDNGYGTVCSVCNVKDKNYKPKDEKEYKYIELSNIGKYGEVTDCTIAIGSELPTRARRRVQTNDVVISSIEGSLESCALITEEYNNALCSTGFYIINSEIINSETLLVLFKSELMQNILKQNCSGTILTAINKEDFLNIPVPIIKKSIQNEIKLKVRRSFQLRKQSNRLLEVATRAVELAIEKDEVKAITFINDRLECLNT